MHCGFLPGRTQLGLGLGFGFEFGGGFGFGLELVLGSVIKVEVTDWDRISD